MADWYVEQVFTYVLLYQYAKKVVSDSPGLDFGYRLVNSVLNLPYWQMNFF